MICSCSCCIVSDIAEATYCCMGNDRFFLSLCRRRVHSRRRHCCNSSRNSSSNSSRPTMSQREWIARQAPSLIHPSLDGDGNRFLLSPPQQETASFFVGRRPARWALQLQLQFQLAFGIVIGIVISIASTSSSSTSNPRMMLLHRLRLRLRCTI